jgi:pimeloyl-ACP methyl ester carboxylesterase
MEVEGRYVDIDGEVAYVETRGTGPSVLCLHSAGQSGRQWRDVLAELPTYGWTLHVPDLPGHGRSDVPGTGPIESIEQYARWCGEVISMLDLTTVFVIGCSIGGKIALEMASALPDRISGVIAMAADGWNKVLSTTALRRSWEDSSNPSRSDRTYFGTLAVCGSSIAPERAEAIARRHRCEDPVVSVCDLIAWAEHDLRGRANDIGCPVCLAYGTDDFWVDGEDVIALASLIPASRCEELQDVGHYPMEEVPGFSRQLHEWLVWLRERTHPRR